MKVVIFTSNAIRHKFFANKINNYVEECMIFSESKPLDSDVTNNYQELTSIQKHFYDRFMTEKKFFEGNDTFLGETFTINRGQINSLETIERIRKFQPDVILVFGSSILKEEIIRLVPTGKFLNMHLGISPYYRGSGTNFWPFVNNELEFVGATILHIDPGIDTGDIVTHIRPIFEINDNVHSIGCKIIQKGTETMIKILEKIKENIEINREKQWKVSEEKYYRMKDFDESALKKYHQNLKNGIIKEFLQKNNSNIKLIKMKF